MGLPQVSGLPAAAEGAVKVHVAEQLGETGVDQAELRLEAARVAVEHLEVAAAAALITQLRQGAGLLGRAQQRLSRGAQLAAALVADQSVGDLAQGLDDRL